MSENVPDEKPLQSTSFAIHATRGVIRSQTARRKAMFALLVVAMLMLFLGLTILAPFLNPREHLVRALFFWTACVWITVTALLLALFDMLLVRRAGRAAERALRQGYSDGGESTRP